MTRASIASDLSRVTRASIASDSRETHKFYVIQFASGAQSSFGSPRIAHGSLSDARRDSLLYNIQVHELIKITIFFLLSFNDAQFIYNYMYVWLLINCFVLYVWNYFGQSFMFGAISDIKTKTINLFTVKYMLAN